MTKMKRYMALCAMLSLLVFVTSARADFVRGDFGGDGVINLVDAIEGLLYLSDGGPPPTCFDAADVNDSGNINIVDSVHVLAFLFSGGPAPANPFPSCGDDPTADSLDCASSAFCP